MLYLLLKINLIEISYQLYKVGNRCHVLPNIVHDDWNYLTAVIDLAYRKIVGWSLSEDMTVEHTVYQTQLQALKNRAISSNYIFHLDRGF
jgi:transposase InsO family protein